MDLKHKILALTVLPLLLAMVAIGALVQHRSTQLAEQQVALIEENFLLTKRAELRHYVELALSSMLLVSIKFQFELAQHQLEQADPAAAASMARGLDGLSEAIGEVRQISHNLRPSILDTLGLSAAVEQLCQEFQRRTGIAVRVEQLDPALGLERYQGSAKAVALFRIAQEALTNIERHAEASEVTLSLSRQGNRVLLRLSDNGRGCPPSVWQTSPGIGLRNIRERVEHLAGDFEWQSTAGHTRLSVSLPLEREALL